VKLAGLGKFFSANKDIAANVGTGSVLAGGFGALAGGPGVGLGSALIDFGVTYPLTALARKVRPPKQSTTNFIRTPDGKYQAAPEYSRLEGAANLGGSLLSAGLSAGLMPGMPIEPTITSQDQTLYHEMLQRQQINNMQTPQAVAPGTQFQMAGIEFLNQYINPSAQPQYALPVPARVQQALDQTGMRLM
jgi:hypothetical protein